MSNPESFIDEVTEEVRRDKMFALMRRYGWIPVLIVVLAVGGAAINEWNKARNREDARAYGDALLAALGTEDARARADALAALATDGDRAAIAGFLAATAAQQAGDTAAALAELATLADDNSLPQSYRQLAILKRVVIGGTDLPLDERRAALQQLATPGQAYRPMAMEQLALLDIEAGNRDAAITRLHDILKEPNISAALQQRVSQAIVALGGEITSG
ncbi:MAG: hypothetical protein H5U19_06700 [Rhodobacteraceae bacterium]|nr:hypothetical protein [Paracoccaceae bacterium]